MGMAAADSQFHVLAVDDSLIDRMLIERLLKTSSYHVTTVDSGSKALEFLGLHEDDEQSNSNQPSFSPINHQEVEVHLVITDYCMPGMTGYDLLKKIKESSSLRNIPVVIMSSENVPSRISRCLEEGAEEFFLKPVRLSDVSKLRPHMMKTKCKNQQNAEKLEMVEHQESLEPEKQEKQQNQEPSDVSEIQLQARAQVQQQLQQQQQQQQQQQTQSNNSKRKSMEEGLSPERTRPRYNDLTVVSN